jgi:hypothetical protein
VNRDREHCRGLRVGLSGAEVSREDDESFGDPVVETATLRRISPSPAGFSRKRRAAAALERKTTDLALLHRSERLTVWIPEVGGLVLPLPRKGTDHLGRDEVRE